MNSLFDHSREVGGIDPLDSRLGFRPTVHEVARLDVLLRSRAALGLAPASAPALVFIPLGTLFGPHGLNLLSPAVLGYLSPVVSVGLAALGVFVGLGLGHPRRVDRRLLAAASLEASLTIAVVAGALAIMGGSSWSWLFVAVTLGVVASASSAGAAEVSNAPLHRLASRIADLDDVLPIVVGGVLLACLRADFVAASSSIVITLSAGLLVAASGWLLLDRRTVGSEQVALFAGLLLLLGGSAQVLRTSALLTGLAAGLAWAAIPGGTHESVRGLLGRIQHPVVVLVLLVAGASLHVSATVLWLVAPYVALRAAGKLLGGWVASITAQRDLPRSLGWFLMAPGVIGIAFALNAAQVLAPDEGGVIVGVAVLGTMAWELGALLLLPRLERTS